MSNIENIDTEDLEQMAELIADIIAEREKQGISQSALAEMSGVKQSAISRMESLKSMPQLDTLIKIIKPLNMKLIVVDEDNYKEYKNMKYNSEGILDFKINVSNAKIKLEPHEGIDFLAETEKRKEFLFSEKNGVLTFMQKKRNIFKRIFTFKAIPVTILVPSSFGGSIDCRVNNGRVTAADMNARTLSLFTDNGAVLADNISAGEMSARSGNGRVVITNSRLSTIDATTSNGRVIITDTAVAGEAEAASSNGRVIISGVSAESFSLRTSNGAVFASECRADKYVMNSSNGKIVVVSGGSSEEYGYDLKTSNGSIYINNQKYSGGYVEKGKPKLIKASTSNGSIRIVFSGFVSDDVRREIDEEKCNALTDSPDLDSANV